MQGPDILPEPIERGGMLTLAVMCIFCFGVWTGVYVTEHQAEFQPAISAGYQQ